MITLIGIIWSTTTRTNCLNSCYCSACTISGFCGDIFKFTIKRMKKGIDLSVQFISVWNMLMEMSVNHNSQGNKYKQYGMRSFAKEWHMNSKEVNLVLVLMTPNCWWKRATQSQWNSNWKALRLKYAKKENIYRECSICKNNGS